MVSAWRAARTDPFLVAEGLLELAGVTKPSRKQQGAAAVIGEFLVQSLKGG